MNNKRTLVNLYKDIELVTRVRIFCTTMFTHNNVKFVIQMHAFLMDLSKCTVSRDHFFFSLHSLKGEE